MFAWLTTMVILAVIVYMITMKFRQILEVLQFIAERENCTRCKILSSENMLEIARQYLWAGLEMKLKLQEIFPKNGDGENKFFESL